MKKLLVLTDFTANAQHAEAAAVRICSKSKMDLLLYHAAEEMVAIPAGCNATFVIGANPAREQYKVKLIKEVETLKHIAVGIGGYLPTISFICSEDNLGDDIKRLSERTDIHLVIIGGRLGKRLDHLLSGSETKEVIDNSRKPVLIIPEGVRAEGLKKVIFATDFAKADQSAVRFLVELTHVLGLELEAAHVVKRGELYDDFDREVAFCAFLEQQGIPYETLFHNTVTPRLKAHCYQTGAGLLAMTHGHHSWISRLFSHSESEAVIDSKDIAVMLFPPKINN